MPDAEVVEPTEAAPSFDADAGFIAAAAAAGAGPVAADAVPEPDAVEPASAPPVARPVPPASTAPPPSPHAERLRELLESAGLPNALVRQILDEALRHGMPFASARSLEAVVRAALVQRLPTMGPIGAGPRTVAVVGPAGSGKSTAAARLATAYRSTGTAVRELAPGDPAARTPFDGLTVIDFPSIGMRDGARIAQAAQALGGVGAEVHLALPATMSGPAAGDIAAALAPLGPTYVLLTHADETTHPGAAIGHAMATGLPLSYVSGADELLPADANDLAERLVR